MEVLLGLEEINGSHTGLNLAHIVEKVFVKHNLTHRLLAITANNDSNNAMLRCSLETALQSKSIDWNVDAMTVNCLAHILNLSAKALLSRLSHQTCNGCIPDEVNNTVYDSPADSLNDDDDEELDNSSPQSEQVGDTVLKGYLG